MGSTVSSLFGQDQAQNGVWCDETESAPFKCHITVPAKSGAFLLSSLTTIIGFAGMAAWTVTAFAVHQRLVAMQPTLLVIQLRLLLRRGLGAWSAFLAMFQLHRAYKTADKAPAAGLGHRRRRHGHGRRAHRRNKRQKAHIKRLMWTPLLILAIFTVAGVFAASTYENRYGSSRVPHQPGLCGLAFFDTTTTEGLFAFMAHTVAKALAARQYAIDFYQGTTSTSSRKSILPVTTLPITTSTTAPCPLPFDDRCIGGLNQSVLVETPLLNSNVHFGVNQRREDQITARVQWTCSPVHAKPNMRVVVGPSFAPNRTFQEFDFGVVPGLSNYTYRYDTGTPHDNVGYQVQALFHKAGSSNQNASWIPIRDFQVSDGDVMIVFLMQNSVSYTGPVYDPWFSANGTYKLEGVFDTPLYQPDYYVNVMACVERMEICNPNTNDCTGLSSLNNLLARKDNLGLNPNQAATASRLSSAMQRASIYNSVNGLGSGALQAQSLLSNYFFSTALVSNQWQKEVELWIMTSLARMAIEMSDYPNNNDELGPYGSFWVPNTDQVSDKIAAALIDQCWAQVKQDSGDTATFSLFGVLFIVIASALLILTSLLLAWMLSFVRRHWHGGEQQENALKADNEFHLLGAMFDAIGHEGIRAEEDGIPIMANGRDLGHPVYSDGLWRYPAPSTEDESLVVMSDSDDMASEGETRQKTNGIKLRTMSRASGDDQDPARNGCSSSMASTV